MTVLPDYTDLIKQQNQLLEEIKRKHEDFYLWATHNEVDLRNLKKYSATITAALLISLSAANAKPLEQKPQLVPMVQVIQPAELRVLDEDAKAKLVWKRYGNTIHRASQKYNVDSNLIFSTIMVESGGNTYAIRQEPRIGDASYGLGQILYGTAVGIGYEGSPDSLYDPEVNIDLVGRYHKRNLEVYGGKLTTDQLITAYNTGNPYSYALPGHLAKFYKWYVKTGDTI